MIEEFSRGLKRAPKKTLSKTMAPVTRKAPCHPMLSMSLKRKKILLKRRWIKTILTIIIIFIVSSSNHALNQYGKISFMSRKHIWKCYPKTTRDVIICLPLRNGCHNEGPEPGSADGDARRERPLLLEVHRHADDGRQVDQSEASSYSSEKNKFWNLCRETSKRWIFANRDTHPEQTIPLFLFS